ncbi:MAG: helix-turn-helix transcriptional regulator [Actinomycetia bacterium]|nr:helix-turn-helix transcriptional regulator [Actinomycetes bacterium]
MGRRSSQEDESRYAQRFSRALGRTIKVRRTDLGIGRRELAERARISYSYLTEIENGNKPPSPSVLGPIAEALGLRLSELTQATEKRMESPEQAPTPVSAEAEWSRRFASERAALEVPFGELADPGPFLREPSRNLRATMVELERLIRNMAQEDVERLLDYARRLTR